MRKLLSTAIAVGVLTSTSLMPAAFAGVDVNALPTIKDAAHDVVNAQVTTPQTGKMNVRLKDGAGTVSTVNWDTYNVGKNATVNYEFTGHNQTSINKVNAANGLSQIYGQITDSGCAGCGYEASGKIILLNPNGVLFGEGANVNVNSFTVSNMDGDYDAVNKTMKFTKGQSQKNFGIVVEKDAKIHGDKNVAFATDNVTMYNGSQISTNTGKNVGDYAYGKVKIVTSDGVNFEYYNNGAIKDIKNAKTSSDKMYVSLNGTIDSGHIDIRNYSNNEGSEINLKGANLKATKAELGNDGNIWLTSYNKIVSENTNYNAGSDVDFAAEKKISLGDDNLKAGRNVILTSNSGDIGVDKTIVNAKDVNITAGKVASVQNASEINADNLNINGSDVYITSSNVNLNKKLKADAKTGDIWTSGSNIKAGEEINLKAAHDVFGDANVNNSLVVANAGNDINLNLKNVSDKNKGIIAEAAKNVTLETDGTLSVSSIISRDGNVTLTAKNVIAGLPYTTNEKIPTDPDQSPRSYIYVKNGTFTSNTPDDPFVVTLSDTPVRDGQYYERHHIQYGDGQEKILLITDLPSDLSKPQIDPVAPELPSYALDDEQAEMLNRIPRQPEVFNNNVSITNNKTALVDVFAAASQIEIEEDEE